MIIIIN